MITTPKKTNRPSFSARDEKLLTYTAKKKLNTSGDNSVLRVKTRGQPLYFARVAKARKNSLRVSSTMVKRRGIQLGKIRKFVSGDLDSSDVQLATDIRRLTKDRRTKVCKNAGLKQTINISKELGLAMKGYINLSWQQKRKLRVIHRSLGIQEEGEKQQFKLRDSVISDTLEGKSINMKFTDDNDPNSIGGITVKKAPVVIVRNLQTFIAKHIEGLKVSGKLTSHEGVIPENEIWIKLLGDKGGGSFKMCFQIMNCEKANSPDNTVIFACFKAPDSYSNLKLVLDYYVDAIDSLDSWLWQEHNIKVFISGDIAFLCSLLGLSTATSTYPCYSCLIDKKMTQTSVKRRGKVEPRTLHHIKEMHRKFMNEVQGDRKKQSKYYNVVEEPILDIDIDQIAIPYLHILHGIVKKHHDMLELECHNLDCLIAAEKAGQDFETSETHFDQYVDNVRAILQLEKKVQHYTERIDHLNDTDQFSLADNIRTLK